MKILIAEDDRNLRTVLTTELLEEGFEIAEAENGAAALDILEKDDYDILLLDLILPALGGMEVLDKINHLKVPVEVIVLTGHGTISTAVEAMKLGAYDFFTKPFKIEELKVIVRKAFEKKQLREENILLRAQMKRQALPGNIITENPVMCELLETVRKAAISDAPVLVLGESGVGKELVARALYDEGLRAGGSFIAINCGSIPENLLESELFGHEKGAFTGANSRKPGLIEMAHKGVLFLDEIGEMPLQLQAKILRVIESGSFYRVGGTKEIKVDTKFVAATNKDLYKESENGAFRMDLYYRISVITIEIPPLRERIEDIPLLLEHFLRSSQTFRGRKFSDDALTALANYSWPGNVRELQNVIHRAMLLTESDVISASSLPSDIYKKDRLRARRLDDVEKEHILHVLKEVGGNRGDASKILGIDPKTLYRKLRKYGIGK